MMIQLTSRQKHILHCTLLFSIILLFEIQSGGIKLWYSDNDIGEFDPFVKYGYYFAWLLYILRLITLLPLPQFLCNFVGLICFNAFPEDICLEKIPLVLPYISVRTVTRGDYPELVRRNVLRNIETCLESGLSDFIFEIVSDKAFEVPNNPRIRLVVVPPTYKTKTGTLFKVVHIFLIYSKTTN